MSDQLHKFLFIHAPVRGETLRLEATWQRILQNHRYPPAVMHLLGEMVAASALLTANLKFNGALVLQLFGSGPIQLLVVECSADLGIRATVKLHAQMTLEDDMSFQQLVNQGRQGRFSLTLDPYDRQPGQQPYQGIVPLVGDSVAAVLENYMRQSEQLETKLWLAANDQVASGLLLQKMPDHGGHVEEQTLDVDAWSRTTQLASTIKTEELLTLPSPTLIHRLFWQENLHNESARDCRFHCTCSREKVANMLRTLGTEEIAEALSEQEVLTINCEFCNAEYRFDAVDCAGLFVELAPGSTDRH